MLPCDSLEDMSDSTLAYAVPAGEVAVALPGLMEPLRFFDDFVTELRPANIWVQSIAMLPPSVVMCAAPAARYGLRRATIDRTFFHVGKYTPFGKYTPVEGACHAA